MKKLSLVLLLWLCSQSQAWTQRGLEIGIIGIPQISFMRDTAWNKGTDERKASPTIKGAAGVQLSLNLTHGLGLGAGFLYASQGQHFTGTVQIPDSSSGGYYTSRARKFGYNTLYYQIPFFIKLNTDIQGPVSFVLMAGGQFGMLQRARYFDEALKDLNDNIMRPAIDEDRTSDFKSTDLSAMIAFDGRYNLSRQMHLSLLLRGDYSLQGIFKANPNNTRNLNIGLQLGLHYVIGF
jgi:hypothetical protein